MADKEKVAVKLGISGTYWDNRPQYRIMCNDTVLQEGTITAASGETEYLKLEFEYDTEQVEFKIALHGKVDYDTKQSEDKTAILDDMLLNIESLEVDEIELDRHLLFKISEYRTDKPVMRDGEMTRDVRNCMNLGWNGVWSIRWSNPFYIWLLETI